MRIKNFLSCVCAASLVALSLVGCSDYDNGYTKEQLQFIQNFKDIYGNVDPTQDWNFAERANVTVTTSTASNIKIYAKTNGKYKIVGDYENVLGTQNLGFDVVEGTTDIMVSNGQTAQRTTVGGGVSFSSTRTIYEQTTVNNKVISEKVHEWCTITKDVYSAWVNYIPEGQFNLDKVSQDFLYVSTGDFVIYPVYWNTNNTNTLGIYYYDDDLKEIQYVDIYEIRNSSDNEDELQKSDDGIKWESAAEYKLPYGNDGQGNFDINLAPNYIRAKGIRVKLPAGTVFGMYLKEKTGGKTYYSDSERNPDFGVVYDENGERKIGETDKNSRAPHAATFIDRGHMYIGFEDWSNEYGNSDLDLNDCLFMFGEDLPEPIDDQADKWIICAEDLGDIYDIDYNDVVIEVEYTSGHKTAYVTPLAAGGTLASFVYFGDTPVGGDVIGSDGKPKTGEIHGLFSNNYTQEISGNYTPINVFDTKLQEYSKRTYSVAVGTGFSLSSNVVGEFGENTQGTIESMGGFNIRVVQEGYPVDVDYANGQGVQKIQNTNHVGEENVPYVICLPKYWIREDNNTRGHYRWPMERVPMLPTAGFSGAAYDDDENGHLHTFAKWVADKDDEFGKEWYKYPNVDVTCAPTGIGPNPEDVIRPSDTPQEGGGSSSNDYSKYGTFVDNSADYDEISYGSQTTCKYAILTEKLPSEDKEITITFIIENVSNYNGNFSIVGYKQFSDDYNSWWSEVSLGTSQVTANAGTPNYMAISVTTNTSSYEGCKYVKCNLGWTNATVAFGAVYVK